MKTIITFFIVFIIVYLLYLFLVILNKNKMAKYKDNNYVCFLVKTYNLDKNKLPINKLAHIISLTNAFIISFAFVIAMLVDNFALKMLLAFAILIPLMLLMYYIIGKTLQKKYKNSKK